METKQKTLDQCKDEVCKKWGWEDMQDCIDSLLPTELVKICDEAAELYASEENRKKEEPKQSSPVSLEVEETARKQAQEIIDPLISSGFYSGFLACAKWQSQQPVSIQWFTEKELEVKASEYGTRQSAAFWGMEWLQSELQKRVNSVDPVDFANWICKNFYRDPQESHSEWYDIFYKIHNTERRYYSTKELLPIYLISKPQSNGN